MLDALTAAGHVNLPVALSEETPYRRKFCSVFDTLRQAEFDFDELLPSLYEFQLPDSGKIAGYEVYGLDSTLNERPEAETLEDRGSQKTQKDEPVRYGHKYSWLTRLIQWGASWVAPVDVIRISTSSRDSQTGAVQVQELDRRNHNPKVIVADSLYANYLFLAIFETLQHAVVLVRLRGNTALWEKPKLHPKGMRGAPAKHGPKFRLSAPSRTPDKSDTLLLRPQTIILQAWAWLILQESARTAWNSAEGRGLAFGWHAPIQTTDVAVLDRARRDFLAGFVSDVSLAIRHRAFLSLL